MAENTMTLAGTKLAEEGRIDALRLTAFRTNDPADRQAYFEAASKWFQDRHYRSIEAQGLVERAFRDGDVEHWRGLVKSLKAKLAQQDRREYEVGVQIAIGTEIEIAAVEAKLATAEQALKPFSDASAAVTDYAQTVIKEEKVWLIKSGAETYWSGRTAVSFVLDIDDAVRFARFEDAERVRSWIISDTNPDLAKAVAAISWQVLMDHQGEEGGTFATAVCGNKGDHD